MATVVILDISKTETQFVVHIYPTLVIVNKRPLSVLGINPNKQ